MPLCNNCGITFPNIVIVDGKKRNLQRRKFCLICSPFNGRNTKSNLSERSAISDSSMSCGNCKLVKPITEFYVRRDKSLMSYCISCHNQKAVIRQQSIKQKCVEYKGGECCRCGYKRYTGALEFHHVDPSKKDITIGKIKNRSFEKLKDELDKCELVCSNCHKIKHYLLNREGLETGIEFTFVVGEESKFCKMCNNDVPLRFFYNRKKTNKPLAYCIKCTKLQVVSRQELAKEKALDICGKYCKICNFSEFNCCLEFHHLEPEHKDFQIGRNTLKNFEKLIPEIEKCITVCSCCHKELHAGLIDPDRI